MLFGYVELEPGDDVAALGALLPLEPRNGTQVCNQPCPAHAEGRCTIYTQRPKACRSYRCLLLREVESQPDRLPAALEKTAQLTAGYAQLELHLRRAGYLAAETTTPAAIKAFRSAYTTAVKTNDAAFFIRHREIILHWKKITWVMAAFDEKAAGRMALPVRAGDLPAPAGDPR